MICRFPTDLLMKFVDEIDLKPGDTWFTTNGWGNTTCECYLEGLYKWVIVINEKQKHSKKFQNIVNHCRCIMDL